MSAIACSAMAWGEYAGTRATSTPRASHRATSTRSYPAQRIAMKRTPASARASTASASATSFTKRHTASEPAASWAVCAFRGASTHRTRPGKARSSVGICVASMYLRVENTVTVIGDVGTGASSAGAEGADAFSAPKKRAGRREAVEERRQEAPRGGGGAGRRATPGVAADASAAACMTAEEEEGAKRRVMRECHGETRRLEVTIESPDAGRRRAQRA